jgi:hypothetical protein
LNTKGNLGFHKQAKNTASLIDHVINHLTAQRNDETANTPAHTAKDVAKQQMQEQLNNMANSTQQNQTMLEQTQALTTTISDLKSQVNNKSQPRG